VDLYLKKIVLVNFGGMRYQKVSEIASSFSVLRLRSGFRIPSFLQTMLRVWLLALFS